MIMVGELQCLLLLWFTFIFEIQHLRIDDPAHCVRLVQLTKLPTLSKDLDPCSLEIPDILLDQLVFPSFQFVDACLNDPLGS